VTPSSDQLKNGSAVLLSRPTARKRPLPKVTALKVSCAPAGGAAVCSVQAPPSTEVKMTGVMRALEPGVVLRWPTATRMSWPPIWPKPMSVKRPMVGSAPGMATAGYSRAQSSQSGEDAIERLRPAVQNLPLA